MTALGWEEGWRRGRRRISDKRLRAIEMLKSQGLSNRAIAHRLGVSEKAIRKLVGGFEARRECADRVRRDHGCGGRDAAGKARSACAVDR